MLHESIVINVKMGETVIACILYLPRGPASERPCSRSEKRNNFEAEPTERERVSEIQRV